MFRRVQFIKNSLTRSLYKKPNLTPLFWTRENIDTQVYQVLFDYANVPESKVSLYANLTSDLLIDDREKFGLYLDMLETFELLIPSYRNQVRDWKSGKEAADWIAANLEEAGRLEDVE
ncbi:hypothetical protein HDV04_000178 [Boothiomyces sp. JEL0838]|nr:hypothetical protein HDV04_000178 [Boothiomyces sp. JEL0838]